MNAGHTNSGIYTFRDNLFSQTAIDFYASIDVCSNNAYVTTNSGFLSPTNGAVFLSNSPAFQMGALGAYYYPTNQTNLIYAGSRTAAAAGLYHYTVMTNNMIEGTNMVSIGFHYIAVDASGYGLINHSPDGWGEVTTVKWPETLAYNAAGHKWQVLVALKQHNLLFTNPNPSGRMMPLFHISDA